MVRFSDLPKKQDKREREQKSSSVEGIVQLEELPSFNGPEWYRSACQLIERTLEKVREQEKLDEALFAVRDQGEQLIEKVVRAQSQGYLPPELLIQALHEETASSFLITNPVNVTVYAILMGSTLGLPRERLMELGLAALLHDVGKIRVPQKILYKEKALSSKEWAELRKYPLESFNILTALGNEYNYIAQTALQVWIFSKPSPTIGLNVRNSPILWGSRRSSEHKSKLSIKICSRL